MKKYFSAVALCMLVIPAFGAGRSMVGNMKPASRAVVSPVNQVNTVSNDNVVVTDTADANRAVKTESTEKKTQKVNRDKEKKACVSNNIGIGNTFVWAAKGSNVSNYANMVEDTENPENNVCYVLVGMRSDDTRINTSDIQPQYFEWGNTITCGSWIDEAKMEERILEAKKSARTWGTIGGAVGGAGIGVGAMELFGNKLLSGVDGLGKLQGQKQYDMYTADWYSAKINEFKHKIENEEAQQTDLDNFMAKAKALAAKCQEVKDDKDSDDYKKCQQDYKKGNTTDMPGKYYGLWQYCMRENSGCKPEPSAESEG